MIYWYYGSLEIEYTFVHQIYNKYFEMYTVYYNNQNNGDTDGREYNIVH